MSFPHDPQLPQALDFGAAGLDTRGVDRRSTRGTSNFASSHTALSTTQIVCIECLRPWVRTNERWRLKVTDDTTPETVPYCPDCAAREFDEHY